MPNEAFIDAYAAPKRATFSGPNRNEAVPLDDALRELHPRGDDARSPDERADALVDAIEHVSPRLLVRIPRPSAPSPAEEFEDDRDDEDSIERGTDSDRAVKQGAVSWGPAPSFLRKQREPVAEAIPSIRMETLGDLPGTTEIDADVLEEVVERTEKEPVTMAVFPLPDAETEPEEVVAAAVVEPTEEEAPNEAESSPEEACPESSHDDSETTERLLPLYQVDHFAWPKACDLLERRAEDQLEQLAGSIESMIFSGTRYLGFAAHRKTEGCTTILAATARRLARSGRKVVMVDADLPDPKLAECLGLAVDAGWEKVAAGECGLEEVLIESLGEGGLTLLPWCGPTPESEATLFKDPLDFSLFKKLGSDYDAVLFDLGGIGAADDANSVQTPLLNAECLDSIVLVQDVRDTSRNQVLRVKEIVETAGIRPAGIAENFVMA